PLSNDLTALTFSLSECFDFFIFFGFSCYKITTFCPLLICPIFGEGYKFQDKVNWHKISEYQILSENFIREFQNKVNWHKIRKFQELSEDFKLEFQDKLTNNYSQITQSE
ncbi:MAG: hypothetical protein J5701_01870, partial [Bacteroidales bacterium]|nr:hypothetical protein [Bacteroidales bacterium]